MKITKIFIFIFLSMMLFGCLSTTNEIKDFNNQNLSEIENWQIGFTYLFGTVEETEKKSGDNEITVKKENYTVFNQLLDDIYYELLSKGIKIKKATNNNLQNISSIRISPVFKINHITSVDITIYNSNNELVKRIKVTNEYGGGLLPVLDDNKIAKYCSDLIYKALTNKK